jgi:hypothetical protein
LQKSLNLPGAVPPEDGVVEPPPPPPDGVPPEGACVPPEGAVAGAWGVTVPLPVPPLEGVPLDVPPLLLGTVSVGVVGTVSGMFGTDAFPGVVSGGGGGMVSALSLLPPPQPATAKPSTSAQIRRKSGLMGALVSALRREGGVRSAGSR